MNKTRSILVLTTIILTMSIAAHVSGASVTPTLISDWQSGNAEFECGQISSGADIAYKIDEWKTPEGMDGTYDYAGNTITISESDGKTFDWTSDYPVVAVIVKAGTQANVYYYPLGSTGDTGLVAPEGKDISHATFCIDLPDFEVPETPLGTITSLAAMFGAMLLLRNKITLNLP